MIKAVKEKAEQTWTFAKKVMAALTVWALIFSLATVGKLAVAFDYDEVLVSSAPAYRKASAKAQQLYSPDFWEVVNTSYDLEKPKLLPVALAWIFRVCGFNVTIVTSRPNVEADGLKKEWRRLAPQGRFVFATDKTQKHAYLSGANFLLYFGDSDSDVEQARRAKVFPVRILRAADSFFKDDYHPGTLGELVLPLSQLAI